MTKDQLARQMAEKMKCSNEYARKFLNVWQECVRDALIAGDYVKFSNLGVLELVKRKGRKYGYFGNPVEVDDWFTIKFRPCKEIVNILNA